MLIPPKMKMLGALFDIQLQFCKGVMLKVSELGSRAQVIEEKMSDAVDLTTQDGWVSRYQT